jgi:CRP-like cAMP-binding protein
MKTIADMTAGLEAFAGLSREQLELVAGCGRTALIEPGAHAFRTGDPATTFYAIRSGRIALEIPAPARRPLVIETLDAGDVLGWSWLFEPYRVRYDARAVETVHAVAFDGLCLRGKCDADPELGYALMGRFAQIIIERLQATRMRLLDVYGHPGAEAV